MRWPRALRELGVPHPLHIHGSNLGVAGNIRSTLETIAALEGLPAHLTHIQFHAYGTEGAKKFSSAALQIAEAVNANPQISIDVGPDHLRPDRHRPRATRCASTRTRTWRTRAMGRRRHRAMAGCGVVPFRYREQSMSTRCNGSSAWRSSCSCATRGQVVLTTDHPNGGPFTSYPHLIRLLMDRSFRDEQLAKLHPEVAANCALRSITRELTLDEIAILTACRAGPAARPGGPRPARRRCGGRHHGLP